MSALLQVDSLSSGYGRVRVLDSLSLTLDDGEYVAVIGANGAGKTTLLRTISGVVRASRGCVSFADHDITGLPAHRIPPLGIAHVPEGRQVFPGLTVRDNLIAGAYHNRDSARRSEQLGIVLELFPRLAERTGQRAGTLSGGEQQMLAVGRALMLRPRLLMLDEPSQGLAPKITAELYERLQLVHGTGTTVLLVEQNVAAALRHAARAVVLERGRVVLAGTAAELRDNDDIRRAYLGV